MESIILASQSPRRKQLLQQAEVPFEVFVKQTDESFPANLPIYEIPMFIAKNKALAVQPHHPNKIILAADTVVVLENEIIGKPKTTEEAIATLKKLSGKIHRVITGVVIFKNNQFVSFYDTTFVSFYQLTLAQIEFYVHKYQPFDKAGAYAIQEWIGVVGIEKINGDFYNVMGLPVAKTLQHLQSFNQ
jgi:septum formation protein